MDAKRSGATVSGRVRWRKPRPFPECRFLDVDGKCVGEVYAHPKHTSAIHYVRGYPEHRARRRSDAKRWLLARAAGLAEVPRRGSFGTRYGSPQTHVVVSCGPEGMSVPRGWRVADAYVSANEQTIVTLERNRRRR